MLFISVILIPVNGHLPINCQNSTGPGLPRLGHTFTIHLSNPAPPFAAQSKIYKLQARQILSLMAKPHRSNCSATSTGSSAKNCHPLFGSPFDQPPFARPDRRMSSERLVNLLQGLAKVDTTGTSPAQYLEAVVKKLQVDADFR